MTGCSNAPLPQSEPVPVPIPQGPAPQQSTPIQPPSPVPTPVPPPEPETNELPAPKSKPLPIPTSKPSPSQEPTPKLTTAIEVTWEATDTPAGVQYQGANWIIIQAPQEKTILAVYFSPEGDGPFPVIALLHGTAGFREVHVQLAQELSASGFVTVVGSWFGGHYSGIGDPVPAQHVDDIDWPDGPEIKLGSSQEAVDDVLALISAARTLPKVDSHRVGLFGHSRGSVAALASAASGIDLQAVVAVAGYPNRIAFRKLNAPVLLLQGTADGVVSPEQATQFGEKLEGLGKMVAIQMIEGAPHDCPTRSPWSTAVINEASSFYTEYLK